MKPGLERTSRLLEMMGDPHRGYPVIHITGSNGKTSVARIASAIAAAHGLTVGTYTSPHVERWEERLALNGRPASPDEFAAALADVEPFVELLDRETGDRATIFEILTVAAFAWFAERAVDVAVVEVGLGGRLDSTNVVQQSVAVVTNISLEHTAVLGEDLASIAREKLAIAKPGGFLVTGPLPSEVDDEARSASKALGIPWRRMGHEFRLTETLRAVGGWLCEVEGIYGTYQEVPLRMHGRHQTENLAVAIAACEELVGRPLSETAVRQGAAAAPTLGRLEVAGRQPLVLLDGAHNPAAMRALAGALEEEFPDTRWTLAFGVLGDKDLGRMLPALHGNVAEVFACSPVGERARPAAEVAEAARSVFGPEVSVSVAGSVPEAVTRAVAAAGPDGAVLVTGSLYVVGEARPLFAEEGLGGGRLVSATIAPPPEDTAGIEPGSDGG